MILTCQEKSIKGQNLKTADSWKKADNLVVIIVVFLSREGLKYKKVAMIAVNRREV